MATFPGGANKRLPAATPVIHRLIQFRGNVGLAVAKSWC
jgi:hypothetical protein